MIDGPPQLSGDTLINVGAALFVVGAAWRVAVSITKIRNSIKNVEDNMLDADRFDIWRERLARFNPSMRVPGLPSGRTKKKGQDGEEDGDGDAE